MHRYRLIFLCIGRIDALSRPFNISDGQIILFNQFCNPELFFRIING